MPESPNDRKVLRGLAAQVAEIAALPIHAQKADLWRRLNDLEPVRPMVWINEICWNEMGPEMDLVCQDTFCREWEGQLRALLYQWRHLPVDMIVDPYLGCPLVIRDTGYGLEVNATRPAGEGMVCVDYVPTIRTEADLQRIRAPEVTVDRAASDAACERLSALVGDLVPVRPVGVTDAWFAPWDLLIQSWGVQELYTDMIDRPAFVRLGIDRMTDAMLSRYERLEAAGALGRNAGNVRVGSGGLGYTRELAAPDPAAPPARLGDRWGSATPQIFSAVSPAMHEEFALRYEMRFLERSGLNYYGCCEPLHRKVGILRSVPRLRKISMSPFVDVAQGAEAIGADFVFSHKPNPAVLAAETWSPERARAELRAVLEATRGLAVEVILKDISTVRREPERLWAWAEIAMEEVERFA
jgi:hypothetical protein